MSAENTQTEGLVAYGTGEVILRNVVSKRATHIPRKNIFTLDSKNFGIDELTIEKHAKGDIFWGREFSLAAKTFTHSPGSRESFEAEC